MMRTLLIGLAVVGILCGCSMQSPTGLAPTPKGSPLAANTASYARSQAASPVPGTESGQIAGSLSTPSEFLAPQAVYAITVDGVSYYRVESAYGQGRFTIVGVRPGDYVVYSDVRDSAASATGSPARTTAARRFSAGYTKAVACGLSIGCLDHGPAVVRVTAGHTTAAVDPVDWYGNPSDYPFVPRSDAFAGPVVETS